MQNEWQVESPQTLEFDEVQSIRASIIGGRVDVLVHEEPITRLEVSELEGRPMNIRLNDGQLEITHASGISHGWAGFAGQLIGAKPRESAVITVSVPEETSASLRTVNGDALACGTHDTSLETVSGSILADDTSGTLKVNTVSGEAIVRHHFGRLVVKTVSGEITASGFCDDIRTNSVSGEITLDLLGEPRELEARTVSGDLTVRLPAMVGIDVSASSVSGSLTVNDRKFTGHGKNEYFERGSTASTLTVRASSVSGDVALFHRHPETSAEPASAGAKDGGH
ncbi:DUF4097 family beta strand repeat-containing protein [uncultured Arthrobacter sp.]|uniref:DUF4097 family beta strand repeat-containing protein n=1 Tax=uncultured Arthrobacter sp. TaxID=114050 RepID=UPI0026330E54|nr:DUF4097 family beta strand repeat-containing protein [uncultured Arthrobacter sp.]